MILVPYSPIAFELFGRSIHWYGIIYAFVILITYFFLYINKEKLNMSTNNLDNFFLGFLLSIIFGARIFDFIFYNPGIFVSDPLSILFIWNGGLSFHGGLIGGFLFVFYYTRKNNINILKLGDFLILPITFGLIFGRIGNFLNHELAGKIWDSKYCFVFETISGCRYPSQLFESFYMLIIFLILLYIYFKKNYKPGTIFIFFIILYGLLRFLFNFFRDDIIIIFNLSMGQILSLIMLFIGLYYYYIMQKN